MFKFFFKEKKQKCLLITPPPLECNTFYSAMPILTGQLVKHGFEAQNLDLNIKFFRHILSKNFIQKTIQKLKSKNLTFDLKIVENLLINLDNSVNTFRETSSDSIGHKNAEQILNSALKFISTAYPNLNFDRLGSFENIFTGFHYNWNNIKNMTFNNQSNIFIEYFENIVKDIKKKNFNFIAISVPFIGNIIPALTLSRMLKSKTKAKIVLGGNFLNKDDILKHPDIFDSFCDFILLGDAEESIVQLVSAIQNNQPFENIPGLIFKNSFNNIISNEIKPIIQMNNIANMSLNGIDLDEYMQKYPGIYMMISKGCYWGRCTFCALGPKYSRYAIKSIDKVISDIKELKQIYPVNNWFLFQDDALSPAFLDKFSDRLVKENLNINYSIFARFEKEFTRDFFEKLYKSGLRAIYWGLESGSYSMLKKMNKGINLDLVPEILKNSYELGISNMAGIIVNFPTETQQEYNETLKFLKKVENYVTISPGQFAVMRNSFIEKHHEQFGIKILMKNEFCYCPEWVDMNIDPIVKEKRWNYFCNCVNNGDFKIDENKKAVIFS